MSVEESQDDSNEICGERFSVVIYRNPEKTYATRTQLCTCTLKNSHKKQNHPHHDENAGKFDGRDYS